MATSEFDDKQRGAFEDGIDLDQGQLEEELGARGSADDAVLPKDRAAVLPSPPRATGADSFYSPEGVGAGLGARATPERADVRDELLPKGRDEVLPSPARATGADSFYGTREVGAGLGAKRRPDAGGAEELLFWEVIDAATIPGGYTWGEVTPDGTGPTITGAAQVGGSVVRVDFSAAMRVEHPYKGDVLDPRSYYLKESVGRHRLEVVRVTRDPLLATRVYLHTEELSKTPLEYTVTVRKAQDANGDPVGAGGTLPISATFWSITPPYDTFTDAHFFYGLQTGFQSDTGSGLEPDVTGPVLTGVDPVEGSGYADKATNVLLTIEDAETGVNHSSIEVDMQVGDSPGDGTIVPIWRGGAGGAQPGPFTVAETPTADGYQYEINPDSDFVDGKFVTIYGRATNLAPLPVGLDDSYWFRIFDKYGIVSVVQTGDFELTFNFAEDMKTTGPEGAALLDPASYTLDESGGVGVPIAPSAVTFVNVRQIKVTVPLATSGEPYLLEVVGGVAVATGELITGALAVYDADVSLPYVKEVEPLGPTRLRVTFSREMENNADLVNPEKYRFTEGLFAALVTRTGADTVEVTTSRQIAGRTYSLRVNP